MLIPNGFYSLLDTCILLAYDNDPSYYQICCPFKMGLRNGVSQWIGSLGRGFIPKEELWIEFLYFFLLRFVLNNWRREQSMTCS